jgi:heme/copper-type cytochrome/quinol oxidase subunit 2
MTERVRPHANLIPPSQEPRSLWKPIVTTILASLALAFSTCVISAQFWEGALSRVLWSIYTVFISIFLCSVVVAAVYFLVRILRKARSK